MEEKAWKAAWIPQRNVYKVSGSYSETRKKVLQTISREQCFFTFYNYVERERIHGGLGSFTSYDE